MITDILKMLRGRGAKTAADLRKALTEAEAALPAAEAELGTATAERAGLLLTGTDAEVLACERRIEAARLTVDRLRAAAAELSRRAGEAERHEAEAALDREIAAAEEAAASAAQALVRDYERLASAVGALLERAQAADELVRAARFSAMKAGRAVDIKMTEERIAPQGRVFVSFVDSTSLKPVGAFDGFGLAKHTEALIGGPREVREPA